MCIYVYMLRNQSPGPISGSNLTGTNLRVQSPGPISDVHICAYVSISCNICVYQIYMCIYLHISYYLIISDYICAYLFVSGIYPPISACIRAISVHIYIYLCISVHICLYPKTSFRGGKTNFLAKKIFGFKSVLKTGGPVRSSKIKNSHVCIRNRSQDLPVPFNSPNHLASTAVHIFHLILYIFLKHVHICLYRCISWHMQYEQI